MACSGCGQLSGHVHAHRHWQLADLPVGGRAVIAWVGVRRLVCAAESCSQRTLREQVPALARRWARRTRQLTALVADLSVSVVGRAGAAATTGTTRRRKASTRSSSTGHRPMRSPRP
ncbi:transposase family protein [Micromonospora craterilacus]|uniref:transposase family protein n=1 Tax=Micromonospora craterilacus TaxID=1655439 RepID=UPI000DAA8E0D